jgi:hypothetical protein
MRCVSVAFYIFREALHGSEAILQQKTSLFYDAVGPEGVVQRSTATGKVMDAVTGVPPHQLLLV